MRRLYVLALALVAGALALAAGCTSSASSDWDDPTTRALDDPMDYSPPRNDDVMGGGITNFDRDAFNRDMDHVLNP
jgi:hypothetical protein